MSLMPRASLEVEVRLLNLLSLTSEGRRQKENNRVQKIVQIYRRYKGYKQNAKETLTLFEHEGRKALVGILLLIVAYGRPQNGDSF